MDDRPNHRANINQINAIKINISHVNTISKETCKDQVSSTVTFLLFFLLFFLLVTVCMLHEKGNYIFGDQPHPPQKKELRKNHVIYKYPNFHFLCKITDKIHTNIMLTKK